MQRTLLKAVGVLILIVLFVFAAQVAVAPEDGAPPLSDIGNEQGGGSGDDSPNPTDNGESNTQQDVAEFRQKLEEAVRIELGQPIEGYEPFMFMHVFPNLKEEDFDGVEALIGHYELQGGALVHEIGDVKMLHSAAGAISEEGIETLMGNVETRFGLSADADVDEVIDVLKGGSGGDKPIACTMDAKLCPDGSAVGRVGPNCEFAPCPGENSEAIVCTDEMKQADFCTMEYAPVCGLVQVQCITTPCDPVPETFSNGCSACSRGNVISYTEGECEL